MSRVAFLIIFTITLTGCSKSESSTTFELTLLLSEFYSGAPISDQYLEIYRLDGDLVSSGKSDINGNYALQEVTVNETLIIDVVGTSQTFQKKVITSSTRKTIVVNVPRPNETISVPVLLQYPSYPNGCEITSLTAILNYFGGNVSIKELDLNFLPKKSFEYIFGEKYGPDPNKYYAGEPSSVNGTYSYAEPITITAQKYIQKYNLPLQVRNISHSSQDEITRIVNSGLPVQVWVTLDLSEPRKKEGWRIFDTNEYHMMYQNLHSVVVIGIDDYNVDIMDPIKGYVTYNKEKFFKSYVDLNMQALVIEPQ